jgi:excisionase family DNA binding protein
MKYSTDQERPRYLRGAMTIVEFCARYSVGKTLAYEEIKRGRLSAVKCGGRTLIRARDAEAWLARLPAVTTTEPQT